MKVPQKARNAFDKGREAFASSKFEEAQKQVTKALDIYPHFAEAITLQGLLFLQRNDLAQSEKEFESAIQSDPNYPMAYLALGTVMNSLGHYDDAARTLERSISMSPGAWQGYFEMAKAYLGQGMYDKALQVANKAQTLAPSNFAAIHLLKAYALLPQKLYKDAVQELQAFLSRGPKGPSAQQAQQLLAKAQAAETASEHSGQ
jgi:tetratricopeptide (TPR) repeat protein